MAVEGVPTKTESKEEVDSGYDREAVYEQAEAQLQERLTVVEIDEAMPEQFQEVARLEQLMINLDTEDFDNADRHLARLAEETLSEKLGDMSQRNFTLYHNYRPQRDEVATEAV